MTVGNAEHMLFSATSWPCSTSSLYNKQVYLQADLCWNTVSCLSKKTNMVVDDTSTQLQMRVQWKITFVSQCNKTHT